MSKPIDIKCENLFPLQFRFLGYALLIGAVVLMVPPHPLISAGLLAAGLFIITAYNGTQIDPVNKTVREYNSYLFFKTGKTERYNSVEKIFINGGSVEQILRSAHTMQSTTISDFVFSAFLKLDNGEKILLLRKKNKDALIKKLEPIAKEIGTVLID